MSFPTLIIGGGISGITAAVEMAEAGQEVVLIEKKPYLGGNVSGFNNYFPKLCPPACGLEINYKRIRSNSRITYYTGAQLQDISGSDGDFNAKILLDARLINSRCTSCGKCAEVCPEIRPTVVGGNPEEKAAYVPGGLAFPMKYTIDEQVCKKEACGKCLAVCGYEAIQLDAKPVEIEIQAKKIIVATGWRLYDASRIENYRYSEEPDVVTNLEFEHMLAACTRDHKKLIRPSDGEVPKNIAFIQCAGSRDHLHLPYCSAVCCSASLKHALTLAESYPEMKTEIFYIDLRLAGRNEKLLNKAQESSSITLTKGKVGRINSDENGNGLILEVEDIMAATRRMESYDMVVLAMGLVPNHLAVELPTNNYGFYEPGMVAGMIPAATCKRPMDVASSVRDATAAVLKAMQP
ncbi:MAG: FAD-dependent oxidoreductase [Bacteroidota bacterium]